MKIILHSYHVLLLFSSENYIKKLLLDPERREFIKELWSGKYGVDLDKRPSQAKPDDGVYGSFRKLET